MAQPPPPEWGKLDQRETSFASLFPNVLIAAVIDSDHNTNGHPELPRGGRKEAVAWLRRVLVDFDALEAHVGYLRDHAGASLRLGPVGKSSDGDTLLGWGPDALHLGFRHHRPLEEVQAFAVAGQGLEVLDDATLAVLMLNPVALDDLAALIQGQPSGGWRQALRQAGKERMAAHGRTIPLPASPSPGAEADHDQGKRDQEANPRRGAGGGQGGKESLLRKGPWLEFRL